MADDREPPPLQNNFSDKKNNENDDLFVSALESQPHPTVSSGIVSDPLLVSPSAFFNEEDDEDETQDIDLNKPETPSPGINNIPKYEEVDDYKNNDTIISPPPAEQEVPLDRDDDDDIFAVSENTSKAVSMPSAPVQSVESNIVVPPPNRFPPLSNSMHRVLSDEMGKYRNNEIPGDDQYVNVEITEPQKVGDGMGAFVAYCVKTNTNMTIFKKPQFSVMRRFSDFLGLHDKLSEKYLRTGRIVPPAPEKSMLGSTKVKMTDQGSSGEFIERRRASLERYVNRTAMHPMLRVDPDFREFLESEGELPRATNTSALSGAGVLRLFNKVGETVNKMAYKMEESDPWFEEKVQDIDNLDNQMRRLLANAEGLVDQRRELANSTAAFAKATAMLSNCEEHNSLSRALAQLAEVEEKVEALYAEQSNEDFGIFCELVKDYVSLIGAIKDVFHERVKVHQNWQHAQMMLNKKREAKAKMEILGRTDKSNQAREEVLEWEGKVERCQEEFDNISKMIKKELERFEVIRVKDFKQVLIKYIESIMNNQMKLIKYWDSFLPEAKAIV